MTAGLAALCGWKAVPERTLNWYPEIISDTQTGMASYTYTVTPNYGWYYDFTTNRWQPSSGTTRLPPL